MSTDRRSQRASEHPINGSRAERARYLIMLGHWARGDFVGADFGTIFGDDHTDYNAKK